MTNGSGSALSACAVESAMGMASAAAALLVMISVVMSVMK